MYQQLVEYLRDKKVLLLGFSREGRSTYNFMRRYLPSQHIDIADMKEISIDDENVTLHCGDGYLDAINDAQIVIKAPGVPLLNFTKPENVEITCQVDLFLRFAGCMCIGVTGTKGKTTTSTLIHAMLRAGNKNACLIGNMGYPVLDSIEDNNDIAVIEMSSHMLEYTSVSPQISVLTNVYPEHLDHYDSYECYVNAKLNIVKHQHEDDLFIYNKDQGVDQWLDLSTVKSEKLAISADDPRGQKFEGINERIVGGHNIQDCLFASEIAKRLGVTDEEIMTALEDYEGIEHRLEPVGTFLGIKFYNDCIATIPHSVACAVDALKDVDTLIFGGMDRGIDYQEFESFLKASSISNLICMPETGHKIGMKLANDGCTKNIVIVEDMEGAVRSAFNYTSRGKICLLSPAAPSYNKYKCFEEKGRHYKSLIKHFAAMGGERK